MDAETMALCVSYAGPDFDRPREIVVEALCEYGGHEWSLEEFQADLASAIASIPADKRAATKVELEGDEYLKLRIWYRRLETDAEVQERVARCLEYAQERQARERATYESLKRKFSGR